MSCILLEILLASSEFIFKERREGHKKILFSLVLQTIRTNVLIVKCLFFNQILVSVQKLYETNLLLR